MNLDRSRWFLAFLLLGLAACGGDGDGAGADTDTLMTTATASEGSTAGDGVGSAGGDVPEACSFFTVDEIAAAVGLAIQEEFEQGELPEGASECTYRTPSSKVVIVTNPSDPDEFAEFIELFVPDAEAIEGIGDAAYFNGPNLLYVRVGNRGFSVRINDALGDGPRPAMLALAEQGAEKLQ